MNTVKSGTCILYNREQKHTTGRLHATHLLKVMSDLRHIQKLVGYKNSKTSESYTYVSNDLIQRIKSPLNTLNI